MSRNHTELNSVRMFRNHTELDSVRMSRNHTELDSVRMSRNHTELDSVRMSRNHTELDRRSRSNLYDFHSTQYSRERKVYLRPKLKNFSRFKPALN